MPTHSEHAVPVRSGRLVNGANSFRGPTHVPNVSGTTRSSRGADTSTVGPKANPVVRSAQRTALLLRRRRLMRNGISMASPGAPNDTGPKVVIEALASTAFRYEERNGNDGCTN